MYELITVTLVVVAFLIAAILYKSVVPPKNKKVAYYGGREYFVPLWANYVTGDGINVTFHEQEPRVTNEGAYLSRGKVFVTAV